MNELERFAAFNSGLASLLRSGLPLDGALLSLAREMRRGSFRRAVERVEAEVRAGKALSDAVAEERVFPRYYAALVRAGEEGGSLPGLLLQAAREARASAEIATRLHVALVYPGVILACAFGMMCFFGYYVGDVFSNLFDSVRAYGRLPAATRVALQVTAAMPWIGFGGLGVMAGGALYAVLARAFGLPRLTIGIFGFLPAVRTSEVARFAATLNLLTSSGVKLPAALELVADMMHVPAFRHACLRVCSRVREGAGFASALKEERVFPYFFSWAVGAEEGGAGFEDVLVEMARLYQERARRSGELLTLLAAPAALIVVAFLVGFVVFAMYLPFVSFMGMF